MKPAFTFNITKKQVKKLKKSMRLSKIYAYMQDGSIVELQQIFPTQKLEEKNPYTFKITLTDIATYK